MATTCSGTNIFSTEPGKVVAIELDTTPVAFTIDDSEVTIAALNGIVTSVGIQGQGGYQFMHSLREFIYIYVFTERMGEIVVNGLAFPDVCDSWPYGPQSEYVSTTGECPYWGASGVEKVLSWYDCNRLTTRSYPMTISFGTMVSYQAFLTGMKVDITNPETGIAQFSFKFNYPPNVPNDTDFCFSTDETCLDPPCEPPAEFTSQLVGWGD